MPVNILVYTNSEFIFKKQRNWYVILNRRTSKATFI